VRLRVRYKRDLLWLVVWEASSLQKSYATSVTRIYYSDGCATYTRKQLKESPLLIRAQDVLLADVGECKPTFSDADINRGTVTKTCGKHPLRSVTLQFKRK
jgi:hypothetical protein